MSKASFKLRRGRTILLLLCHLLNDLFRFPLLRSLLHFHLGLHHLFIIQTNQGDIYLSSTPVPQASSVLKLLRWVTASNLSIVRLKRPLLVQDEGIFPTTKTWRTRADLAMHMSLGFHSPSDIIVASLIAPKLPLYTSSSLRSSFCTSISQG